MRATGITLAAVGVSAASAHPSAAAPHTILPGRPAERIVPEAIPESEYVRATPDGGLEWRGRRVRFWGLIGSFPNLPSGDPAKDAGRDFYRENEAFIRRFEDLGFNLNRMWRPRSATTFVAYTPGDGSPADVLDHFIATAKARGFRFWLAGLGAARAEGTVRPEDARIIDEPETEVAWREAVGDGLPMSKLHRARVWDRRLFEIGLRRMKRVADHFNHYTGLRVADDPVYAAFELSNEEWWIRAMLRGEWRNLPPFFRDSLVRQWNEFLRGKYETSDALIAAWGRLLPGESFEEGRIAFAPMGSRMRLNVGVNDASEAAIEAAVGGAMEVSREDVAPQRASDVLEFLVKLLVEHKQREAAAVKSWGRATRLAPLAYDTGIGYEIQSQFLHQHADVVAHDAYVNGRYPESQGDLRPPDDADALTRLQFRLGVERQRNNRGRWTSWLEMPPGICQGVPWLEHNRVEGKPYFVYETQIQQPAKYRADFPLRLAALSAIQDWDAVAWHYWGGVPDIGSNPRPFDKAMDVTVGGHPQGYHFTYDAVQSAMMRAAGIAFRNFAFAPAPRPTRFIYGRRALYAPESMRYAGSYGLLGMAMLPTTYQYGVRIRIDPTRDEDEVIGPMLSGEEFFSHNPYTPTPEIVFDWQKGCLKMDAPAAAFWTGFLSKHGSEVRFACGAVLRDVRFENDDGIYEPMTEKEGYLAFAVYSEDGRPLPESERIAISLVSTSFNSGFRLPEAEGGRIQAGRAPVLYARVGGTVEFPALDGMKYVFRDWHMEPIGEGVVAGGRLAIPADRPIWLIELTRETASKGKRTP